jgi:hypothetical protein
VLKISREAGTVFIMAHFMFKIFFNIFAVGGIFGSCRSRLTSIKSSWNGLGSVRILLQLAQDFNKKKMYICITFFLHYINILHQHGSLLSSDTKSLWILLLGLSRVDLQQATILGMQQVIKFSSSFRHLGEFIRSVLNSTKSIWIIGLGSARVDPQVAIIEVENKRYKEMQGMVGDMKQFKVNTKKKTQIKKVFLISKFKTGKQEQDEKASSQDDLTILGSQTFQVGGVLQPVLPCHSQHL